jgi:hypothetical protein
MNNVFLLYGNTTKDQSNEQTGGFGLGAKTPFAYSDQFSIVTITPDPDSNGNIRRSYTAYVDESEEGKMRLNSVQPTDDPCGTEISMLVKDRDWKRFEEEAIRETRFWEVRPTLTGKNPSPEYPEEPEALIESETWAVMPPAQGYERRTSRAIVDGIGYDIDVGSLDLEDGKELLNRGVLLRFEVGEVSLAANREQLSYDDQSNTKAAIEKRLNEIRATATARLKDKLDAAESYTEASRIFADFKSVLGCALPSGFKPTWQGHVCSSLTKATKDIPALAVQKFRLKTDRYGDAKVFKDDMCSISLEKDAVIFVNDLTRVNVPRDRVRKILDEKKGDGIKSVYVLTFENLGFQQGLLNSVLPLLDITKLSTIPRTQRARAPRGSRRNVANAWEYDSSYTSPRRNCDQKWRPCDIDRKDGEGVYVILEDHKQTIRNGSTQLSRYDIDNMAEYVDGVYGVRPKDAEKLGKGWVPFKTALADVLKEKLEEADVTLEELGRRISAKGHRLSEQMSWLHCVAQECADKKLLADDSLLMEFYRASSEVESITREYSALWDLSRYVQPNIHIKLNEGAEDPELKQMWARVQERYPLLPTLDATLWRVNEQQKAAVIHYIRTVDASTTAPVQQQPAPKKNRRLKRSVALKNGLKRSVALKS